MEGDDDLLQLLDETLGRGKTITPAQRRLGLQRDVDYAQGHIDACKRKLAEGDATGVYELIGVHPAARKDIEDVLAGYESDLAKYQQQLAALQ